MIVKDAKGNELLEVIDVLEERAEELYSPIKYPAASYGVSNLLRSRAAGYLTLAAFAKLTCKHVTLAHCSRE